MDHLGIDKTLDLISRKYYSPVLYKEVNKYVRGAYNKFPDFFRMGNFY